MFSGSIVALVTPMKADGAVDNEALDRLVEFHVANGTNGIVAVGTTGESPTLSVEEHIGVVRTVVQRACQRFRSSPAPARTRLARQSADAAREGRRRRCLPDGHALHNRPTQEAVPALQDRRRKRVRANRFCTTCRVAPAATSSRIRSAARRGRSEHRGNQGSGFTRTQSRALRARRRPHDVAERRRRSGMRVRAGRLPGRLFGSANVAPRRCAA